MKTFAIDLKQVITDTRNHYLQHGVNSGLSEKIQLEEFRIVRVSTPRQTGNTERIVQCFNPATTVYISPTRYLANAFKERVGGVEGFPCIYLNSSDFSIGVNPLRGLSIETVFFDLGAGQNIYPSTIARIRKLILMIEEVLDTKPIYVIS